MTWSPKRKTLNSSLSVYNSFRYLINHNTFHIFLYLQFASFDCLTKTNLGSCCLYHSFTFFNIWMKTSYILYSQVKTISHWSLRTFRNSAYNQRPRLWDLELATRHKMSTKNYPQTRFSTYSFFRNKREKKCKKASPPPHTIFFLCTLAVTCSFYSSRQVLNKWFCSVIL